MTYADIADVEVDHGPVSDDDAPRVESLIERAEAQLLLCVPDLAARLTAGRTTIALVRQGVSEMGVAVLSGPRTPGAVSFTESTTNGPFSASRSGTLSSGSASGSLALTRRHRMLLGGTQGAQSISCDDPALAHVHRSPRSVDYGIGYDSARYGLIWPEPWSP